MEHKNFDSIIELIYKESPLQRKKIESHFNLRDDRFFKEAEEFSVEYMGYLQQQGIDLTATVGSYLKLCTDMMRSQVKFLRTGKYPVELAEESLAQVYSNEAEMKPYMIGLAISQFIWKTHYDIFKFFVDYLSSLKSPIRTYLEIGPGHGLFLRKAMELLSDVSKYVVVDISPTSIDITKSIIEYFGNENKSIEYHQADFNDFVYTEKCDFITAGEVLEHVDDPQKLVKKISSLLTDEGCAFISTCVNCPAIDHVYHFKKVEEIGDVLDAGGLAIEKEAILPVEDLPLEEVIEKKITINYCAILKKK